MKTIAIGGTVALAIALSAALTGFAPSNAASDGYQLESQHVSIGHAVGHSTRDVAASCATGYHIGGVYQTDGRFFPSADAHGTDISRNEATPSDPDGYSPTGDTYFRTLTVNLHNWSFISDHAGYFTSTCIPN